MEVALPAYPLLGLLIIGAFFMLLAVAETVLPFRDASQSKGARWFTNIGLYVIDTAALWFLLPAAMVFGALVAQGRGWGLLNVVDMSAWIACAIALVVLDLALWLQHLATHRVPFLWRMHRVHHSDVDFDVSTAARFHPFEIVLSMVWKVAVVIVLGAPVLAVIVFELGFALATLFTHTNLALPDPIDRAVRTLLVTPNMHRIHHSAREVETNSNYGTVLSLWDRLFGTYTPDADMPQKDMCIGQNEWRDERTARLGFSLLLPFHKR